MVLRVFYAWQSDSPNRTNRALIREALDRAAKLVSAEIEDAPRWTIDQDTQDIPGSPDIARTILNKIDSADAFVADLTLAFESHNRKAPNPNVLLEYGYALRSLGEERIIGIINEISGPREQLPFDLRGRRFESYELDEESGDRSAVREELARHLAKYLRAIPPKESEPAAKFTPVAPFDGPNANHSPIGMLGEVDAPGPEKPERKVWLRRKDGFTDCPTAFLRVIPSEAEEEKSPAYLKRAMRDAGVHPLFWWKMEDRPEYFRRNRDGAASFFLDESLVDDHSAPAITYVQVFRNCEIWSTDTWLLDSDERQKKSGIARPFIPSRAFQEGFLLAARQYLLFARDVLKLRPPLRWICGLHRVNDLHLYENDMTLQGAILCAGYRCHRGDI